MGAFTLTERTAELINMIYEANENDTCKVDFKLILEENKEFKVGIEYTITNIKGSKVVYGELRAYSNNEVVTNITMDIFCFPSDLIDKNFRVIDKKSEIVQLFIETVDRDISSIYEFMSKKFNCDFNDVIINIEKISDTIDDDLTDNMFMGKRVHEVYTGTSNYTNDRVDSIIYRFVGDEIHSFKMEFKKELSTDDDSIINYIIRYEACYDTVFGDECICIRKSINVGPNGSFVSHLTGFWDLNDSISSSRVTRIVYEVFDEIYTTMENVSSKELYIDIEYTEKGE